MLQESIVFQEVPNEVSLLFQITGCNLRCKGCHSPEVWNKNNGTELTNEYFLKRINDYRQFITCIVFFGGEWHRESLIEKLSIAKENELNTCLYTGENNIDSRILEYLDYLKIGRWDAHRGGLSNPKTNQLFIDLNTGKKLNHLFQKQTYFQGVENA